MQKNETQTTTGQKIPDNKKNSKSDFSTAEYSRNKDSALGTSLYQSAYLQPHYQTKNNNQQASNIYTENDFRKFREAYCRNMQGPFLTFCCYSLSLLLFMRIFVLEFVNIMHSLLLPAALVILFFYFKEKNKDSANLNKYLLMILVPLVVLIVAQKTIS
jgi:hypothetical protein